MLDLTAGLNPGVAFGFATGVGQPFLVILAAAIILWLTVVLVQGTSRLEVVGAGAIIGGAFGNVADRLRYGAVRDFIDFHIGDWKWPTFNLADTFIFVGVCLMLAASLGAGPPRAVSEGQEDHV